MAAAMLPRFAAAQTFLDGATLRVLVGSTPGSSYDRIARLLTGALGERLPSSRIVVETNGKAGGRLAAKELAEAAPDGRTIGFLPTGLIYTQILGDHGSTFDLSRFCWLVSVNAERRVLVVAKRLGIRTVDELLARRDPLIVPSNSTSSASYYEPLLLNVILGTKLKPVPGFSSGGRSTALVGGEVDGIVGSYDALAGAIESDAAHVVLRLQRLAPLPSLRGVKSLADVVTDRAARPLVTLIETHGDFGRFVAAPPNTPADRVVAWRRLIDSVLADPRLLASADRAGIEIAPVTGEEITARLNQLIGDGGTLKVRLKEALSCGRRLVEGSEGC